MLQFLLGGHSPPPPPPPRRMPGIPGVTLTRPRGSHDHTATRSSNRRVWGKSAGASQWPAAGRPVLSTAYVVDLDKLPQTPELAAASAALASTFLLSTRDAETDAFLDKCRRDGRDPAHVARERAGSAAVTDAQRLRGLARHAALRAGRPRWEHEARGGGAAALAATCGGRCGCDGSGDGGSDGIVLVVLRLV